MLVLSRKKKQAVVIGGKIRVVIADIHGDVVKLAIEAPGEVEVYREECYEAVVKHNQAASLRKGEGGEANSEVVKVMRGGS